MTLRQYFIIMGFGTVLGWVAWVFVLFNVDPFLDTGIGFLFFFLTLGFALIGTTSIAVFVWYHEITRIAMPTFRLVQKSFTLGTMVTVVSMSWLFLQGKGVITLWNTIIFIAILLFLLLFKLSLKMTKKNTYDLTE
ncbi:MAG: hypothetical protein KBD15_01020 [Candidatus Magasanikbacteria bacterium]|nr:hypothetical protein [Candidatus Magasanikbacteria bacterium]